MRSVNVEDLQENKFWAMTPESFAALRNSCQKLAASNIASGPGISKASENESEKPYRVFENVAVIQIAGPIIKKPLPPFLSFLVECTSVMEIEEMFEVAISDPKVNAILLDVDSPGGTLTGISELSHKIYQTRKEKPIVAHSSGIMASGAYWLASAADKVVIGQTADVGGIGLLVTHTDYSEMDKMRGVKVTYLTAGKYKALGNSAEPLSDLAKDEIQKQLDYIYGIFTDAVARNRGVSSEAVRKNVADGRIFIGEQGLKVGLADSVGSIESAFDLAVTLAKSKKPKNTTQALSPAPLKSGPVLTPTQALAQAPLKPVPTPTPAPVLSVEDQAKQDFAKSKELKDEFKAESTYVAFKKAESEGKVKIMKNGATRGIDLFPAGNVAR